MLHWLITGLILWDFKQSVREIVLVEVWELLILWRLSDRLWWIRTLSDLQHREKNHRVSGLLYNTTLVTNFMTVVHKSSPKRWSCDVCVDGVFQRSCRPLYLPVNTSGEEDLLSHPDMFWSTHWYLDPKPFHSHKTLEFYFHHTSLSESIILRLYFDLILCLNLKAFG